MEGRTSYFGCYRRFVVPIGASLGLGQIANSRSKIANDGRRSGLPDRGVALGGSTVKNEAVIGGIDVGGQPSSEELASGRFKKVINIRGSAEEGNITGDVLAGSDVTYVSVPWTIDTVTNGDIDRIAEAIAASDDAVLIH
jgi:hypothetical protein